MTDTPIPPSPFLPDSHVQYAWDQTCIGLLKTCPRLYQYTMIEGWRAKDESIHLRFGSEFHAAVHNYDLSRAAGIVHDEAVHDCVRELALSSADFNPTPDTKAGKYKNKESLIRTVINYLDDRQNDPLTTYIMADGKPAVELSFRFELAFGPTEVQPYLLCGHFDRVAVDPADDIFIEDHKTTTTTPSDYYFANYEPNNQMTCYTTAGQVVLEAPIKGVAINAVQLLLEYPYNRFVRGFTFRTNDQLSEWQDDLSQWLQLAEWYAGNNYWPQNDTACDKFGGCTFRKICSKSPSVREIYLNSDFVKLPEGERWNPLQNR